MADITDERLREIVDGTYCGFDEGIAIAAELLAARARIKSLEGCIVRNMEAAIRRIPKAGAARCDPVMAALAQASQERDAARADLRQAIKLIGDAWACQESDDWRNEAWELIEKHRETP